MDVPSTLDILSEAAYRCREPLVRMNERREERFMSTTITGVVKNGVIIPNSPFPEGAKVEIRLQPVRPELTAELQEEFDGWERAGAGTIELVERLAEEIDTHDKR